MCLMSSCGPSCAVWLLLLLYYHSNIYIYIYSILCNIFQYCSILYIILQYITFMSKIFKLSHSLRGLGPEVLRKLLRVVAMHGLVGDAWTQVHSFAEHEIISQLWKQPSKKQNEAKQFFKWGERHSDTSFFGCSPNSFPDPAGKLVKVNLQILKSPVGISCCCPGSREPLGILCGTMKQDTGKSWSPWKPPPNINPKLGPYQDGMPMSLIGEVPVPSRTRKPKLVLLGSQLHCSQDSDTCGGWGSLRKHTWSTWDSLSQVWKIGEPRRTHHMQARIHAPSFIAAPSLFWTCFWLDHVCLAWHVPLYQRSLFACKASKCVEFMRSFQAEIWSKRETQNWLIC